MPEYSFRCRVCGHVTTVVQPMGAEHTAACEVCGGETHRLFGSPRVNWNGLAPSQGELAPAIREHIEHRQERREQFEEMHAAHERRKEKVWDAQS